VRIRHLHLQRVYPRARCRRVSVCLSVCHTSSILYRNSCTDQADFFIRVSLDPCYTVFREVRISSKIRELPSEFCPKLGILKSWLRHVDSRRVRYKQRQRSVCCWQHLARTVDVAGAIYSRRQSSIVDRTRRPAWCQRYRRLGVRHSRVGPIGVS